MLAATALPVYARRRRVWVARHPFFGEFADAPAKPLRSKAKRSGNLLIAEPSTTH